MRKGYIQIYTGNGKGKTTAAFGLALRAAGAGYKVFIAQFIKNKKCSEHNALERFKDLITIRQYGKGLILKREPGVSDIRAAAQGLEDINSIIQSGDYKVVILDEANVAIHCKLFTVDAVLKILSEKPLNTELIITGRYADERIIRKADLVTEMKEVKHYWQAGVKARIGIEK